MKKRLQQLKKLSLEEWRILLFSILLLPFVALVLRVRGVKATQSLLARFVPLEMKRTDSLEKQFEEARNVTRIVHVAGNHGVYRANCLKKALLAQWLLKRRGIHADLHIGVCDDASLFRAHAWLELSGVPLNEAYDPKDTFTGFDSSISFHRDHLL